MATGDRRYFLTEFKIVSNGEEHVAIADAIVSASPFDPGKAIMCLEFAAAAERVSHAATTGEGTIDALEQTMTAMSKLNNGN